MGLLVAAAISVGNTPAFAAGGASIYTIAGTGALGDTGDRGQATEAQINQPRSIFPTADGGYIFAEPWSNIVRKVGPDGVITTVAGTGVAGSGGDGGPATSAQLNFVHGAAPMPDRGFVIADNRNSRIRRVWPNGTITTIAGTGDPSYSGDGGVATAAAINNPRGVAVMPDGSVIFPDTNNHRVRKISTAGIISTVAGTGVQGFSGDGGAATSAQLSIPFGVAPTADGGILVVDVGNQRIRKVSASGVITTVAGTGVKGYSGDGGPATVAQLADPHNVTAAPDGGFLIADASNERVREVAPDGTITTIAGNGTKAFSGDGGPATAAAIDTPKAVAVDAAGAILVAAEQDSRVRFVGTPVAPLNVASPTVSGTARQGQTLTGGAGGWSGTGPTFTYQWRRCDAGGGACGVITGAGAKTYIPVAADVGLTVRVLVTASNAAGSALSSSASSSVIAGPPAAPSNSSLPTISGASRIGQTLTADPGMWTGAQPITFSYQWRRCDGSGASCADVVGANAKTYVVASADINSTLRVVVTASNGSSVYVNAVSSGAPASYWRFDDASGVLVDSQGSSAGSYIGGPQRAVPGLLVGDTDTAVTLNGSSQYLDVPGSASWTRNGFSLEISVRASVLPVNKTIWSAQGTFAGWWLNTGPGGDVRIFVGDGAGWRYGASGPVLNPGTTYHLVVTYDGTNARLYVNGALASTGPSVTMAPTTAVMRFGANSGGPSQFWSGVLDDASFYPSILTVAEIQSHYDASVTGSAATSTATPIVVADVPVNTVPPSVSGVVQDGSTLTADPGSWSGTTPISYSYQWRRCSSAGVSCVDLVGATSQTYGVAGGDVGATLRVLVGASNVAGSGSPVSSAATGVVAAAASSGTLTFNVGASGDDGDLQVEAPVSGGYPPAGTAAANTDNVIFSAGRRLAFGEFGVLNALVRFDTSALPDNATVTSATLKLRVVAKQDADNRNLVGEWYAASSWPIDSGDYTATAAASALAGADITQIAVGSLNSFQLTNLGSVSKAGYTGLRLHVDGGQPAGDNYVQFASFDDPSLPKPQLIVTYTIP